VKHFMLGARHVAVRRCPRFHATRRLFRCFRQESTPEGRGQKLLRQWLSPAQRAMFDANGHLDVIGCHSGRRYRIYYGVVSNIRELNEEGEPRVGLCFAPSEALPAGDVMLAQKIALETDEYTALAVAHRFPSSSRPWDS
jgi:hypothetical protein